MDQPPPLDIVTVLVLAPSPALDGRSAQALGQYMVIITCGLTGAALALSLRAPFNSRSRALLFVFSSSLAAIIGTVPAAAWASRYVDVAPTILLGPVAFGIGRYLEDGLVVGVAWAKCKVKAIMARWNRGSK